MGWLALAAIRPIAKALPVPGLIMLIGGGLFYTVGVIFYALDNKLKFCHVSFPFLCSRRQCLPLLLDITVPNTQAIPEFPFKNQLK